MKAVTKSARSPDQKDRGLGFNGQDNGSSQAARAQGYAGNQHAGKTDPNKTFNSGRGPTVGNKGGGVEGPARPPRAPGVPDSKSASRAAFAGTFNAGAQVRTPGGTRSFDPSAGQNYRGNPDRINEGRGPTKGNSQGPAK